MNDIGREPCRNRFVMALLRENGICNIISIVIEVFSLEEEVLSGGPSLNSHESVSPKRNAWKKHGLTNKTSA